VLPNIPYLKVVLKLRRRGEGCKAEREEVPPVVTALAGGVAGNLVLKKERMVDGNDMG
jgi:hypothetical protein